MRGEHSYLMPIREFDIFMYKILLSVCVFLDLFLDSKTVVAWLLILDAFICWNFIYFMKFVMHGNGNRRMFMGLFL